MTRQVRLDDDVAAFVESRSDGLSLSGATNAVLRSLAAGDDARADDHRTGARTTRIVPGEPGPPAAPIDHPTTLRPPQATVVDLVEADGPEVSAPVDADVESDVDAPIDREDDPDAPSVTRPRRARRERRRPLCNHPLEMRVGLRCGLCGSTFRR